MSIKIISDITNYQIRSLHSDISTKTGEKIIVFTLDVPDEVCVQPLSV